MTEEREDSEPGIDEDSDGPPVLSDHTTINIPKPEVVKQTPEKKKKIGRNEKCPCDSGKKYKKCCLD